MYYDGWMMADEDFGYGDEMAYAPGPYDRYYYDRFDGYYDPRYFRFRRFHPRFRRNRRHRRYW